MEDLKLVNKAKEGDQVAMGMLVNRYSKRVYNLALRIVRNKEEAEDVLQDTFLTVVAKLHTFDGRSSFFTWLYRIATNSALMLLRKKKIRRANFMNNDFDPDQNEIYNMVDWSQDPSVDVTNKEIGEKIEEALGTLREKYRTVFVLRDVEELSTREASEILNISEENVKVRLLRARQYLREYLTRYFQERLVGANG